ncbi:uncharacterized protein E0L32_008947 [Thyridium curvatum]|uniref:Uncharacterized protein n=1 Tax=Thyridium curvatum TaxID=1093900 RepID=A0A507AIF3_9PEZI|nr:uncharacterized protein E0L32_008947 [Thyridium curvatum]TPX09925.1 hypothetical protein E0L32_008947 [Thyridium curvatum]
MQTPVTAAPVAVPSAEEWIVKSAAGEEYLIQIGFPLSWSSKPDAAQAGKPVHILYCTDGNALFFTALDALHRRLSVPALATDAAAAVVVAIGYPLAADPPPGVFSPRRGRDLTPPSPGADPEREGGADVFADFIRQTVRPFVHGRIAQRRGSGGGSGSGSGSGDAKIGREALYGHSYGGLFALHVLFTRPAAAGFDCYVVSSPSVWWNEEFLLTEEEAFRAAAERAAGGDGGVEKKRPQLMMFAGGDEQVPPRRRGESDDRYEERRRVGEERNMVGHMVAMAGRLRASGKLERFTSKVFHGEDHGTVIACSLSRGLTTFFEDWPLEEYE